MVRLPTPVRILLGLTMLIVLELVLSVHSFHCAKQAKADLQQTFPGSDIRLTAAAWVNVRCGRFHLGGEADSQTHRFVDEGIPVATDLTAPDSAAFEESWRICQRQAHGRGDWQDPIFDALVLPRV